MASGLIHRVNRIVTPYALVLLQVHLFGVTMLHHHGEMLTLGHTPSVQAQVQQLPTGENGLPCTACQIVRQSAVQPATDVVVFQPAASVPLPPSLNHRFYRSLQPAIRFGRAPPLI